MSPANNQGVSLLGVRADGLGDTLATAIERVGLSRLADIYTRITGKDCGCKSRQEALNKLFPYGIKETKE